MEININEIVELQNNILDNLLLKNKYDNDLVSILKNQNIFCQKIIDGNSIKFVSDDFVSLYKGDEYYVCSINGKVEGINYRLDKPTKCIINNDTKFSDKLCYFSTAEACQNYIHKMNNIVLITQDGFKLVEGNKVWYCYKDCGMIPMTGGNTKNSFLLNNINLENIKKYYFNEELFWFATEKACQNYIDLTLKEESINYNQVHLSHCFKGEYEGCCKYGEFNTCPADPKNIIN